MPFFDFNTDLFIWQELAVRLRKPKQWAWFKILAAPVRNLYGLFTTNRNTNLYVLAHNSQVCYIQAALNDTFDAVSRGIWIGDPVFDDPEYIYMVDEDKPMWLGLVSEEGSTPYADPAPLYTIGEIYSGAGETFIVHVPSAVYAALDVNRLKALINFYRLPARRFSIVTF